MIKLPKEVKIGGLVYKVSFPHRFKEIGAAAGQTDLRLLEIRLTDVDGGGVPLPDRCVAQTFIHELLHAADQMMARQVFQDNETLLETFSQILLAILVDNKWLKMP